VFPRRIVLSFLAGALLAGLPERAQGVFHAAVIDEVLTSFDGDPDKQFVEMRMLASLQNFVEDSVFAAFDAQGNYVGDILVVPADVSQSGAGTRWLIATLSFSQAVGIVPDFEIGPRALPVGGGMICFGGGGGISPADPMSWSRTNFNTYVDCIAYGSYSGPSNSRIGTPTALNGDGHSLQRTTNTRDNASDFTCANLTPENNAGEMVEVEASDSCTSEGTPTATATSAVTATATASGTAINSPTATPTPTLTIGNTATATATPTVTLTATPGPPIPCVADCDENGEVSLDEVVRAVSIALASLPLDTCEQADPNSDGFPSVDELLRAVASSMRECID
jgi:hypothetical protein